MSDEFGFAVKPLNVGAEIVGLDLTRPFAEHTRAALYSAWLDYGILLFRNTNATQEQHLALSRCFGELEMHPIPEIRVKEQPLLIELGGTKRGRAYIYDEKDMRIGVLPWHRDTAYTVECSKGAILRLVDVPPEGGETMFSDTANAYDGLPEALRKRIDTLEYKATLRIGPLAQSGPGSFWKSVRVPTEKELPNNLPEHHRTDEQSLARYPSVILPAVITHPESGRKCIFPSPSYVDEFLGLSKSESEALLWELTNHMTDGKYVYVHKWALGDMILWDNRRFMHAAAGYHPRYTRRAFRTTLAGSLKVGRYHDKQPELSQLAPIND